MDFYSPFSPIYRDKQVRLDKNSAKLKIEICGTFKGLEMIMAEKTPRKVLITGASRGIGRACALAFARQGDRLYLAARNTEKLAEVAAESLQAGAADVQCIPADLADEGARKACADTTGPLDILVNNAGAIRGGGLFDISMDDWRESWELKVFGYLHMCQLYGALMKQQKSGIIVNIIGLAGRDLRPDYICGSAGNAALIAFTQALGAELQKNNIRVFGINPSATETDRVKSLYRQRAESRFGDPERWEEMLDTNSLPFGRLKRPQEVASLAALCCSDSVQYLSGTVIDMDGGARWM